MRRALAFAAIVALVGCGGRPPPGGPAHDGGAPGDSAVPGDARRDGAGPQLDGAARDAAPLACSGPGSMVLNGTSIPVAVTGRMVFMNCCEAGAFVFDGLTELDIRIVVMWRAQVGSPTAIPFTVDLADLPDGIGVQVISGCGDPPEYCPDPSDSLNTGLRGTLTVQGETGLGYVMTLCLRGEAPPGETHPVLRTIDLWAEDVVAPYPYD